MKPLGNPAVTHGGSGRLWTAKVTSVLNGIIRVEIPDLQKGRQWIAADYTRLTFTVGTAGDPTHVHTVTTVPLAIGNEVLVGFTDPDQPVIVGRKPAP